VFSAAADIIAGTAAIVYIVPELFDGVTKALVDAGIFVLAAAHIVRRIL